MPRVARKLWIVVLAIIVLIPLTTVGAWAASVAYYYQVTWPREKQQRRHYALYQANHQQIHAECLQMLAAPQNYATPSINNGAPTNTPAYLTTLNATWIDVDPTAVTLRFDRAWGLWVPAPGTANPATTVPGYNSRQLVPGLWYFEYGYGP